MPEPINPETLVPMDMFTGHAPLRIDLAYAGRDNLLFGEAIYRGNARLWLHSDLAKIVLLAAYALPAGYKFVLYDGLRTTDAQRKMLGTRRVHENPQWLEEPRLLSPPGSGGHPRGMAVDLSVEKDGKLLDMGTDFDYLAENAAPEHNPAHRAHPHHPTFVMNNRKLLRIGLMDAAETLNIQLLPLPQEWWDFRLPPATYEQYQPLSDADLPPQMRMTETDLPGPKDFPPTHFEKIRQTLLDEIDRLRN